MPLSAELMLLLGALAGAVHVLAPDHWIPSSVVAWQRGWRPLRTLGFVAAAMSWHLLLGVGLYFVLEPALSLIPASSLDWFGVVFVGAFLATRLVRFSRLQLVLRFGSQGLWGTLSVLSWLGPAEALVPILMKARFLGIGFLVPTLAFALGTLVVSVPLVLAGAALWDRPLLLPQGLRFANRGAAVVPVIAALVLGLNAIFRIS